MSEPTEAHRRQHWRILWLSSIQAFGDAETQRLRWLDPQETNPHYTFVECMCCYFDDAFMSEENAFQRRIERGHLTAEEAVAVEHFHTLVDAYQSPDGDDYDIPAILADPKWQAVVDAAKQARQRVMPLLNEPREREALIRPMHWIQNGSGWSADLTGSTIMPANERPIGNT
jgi:hypothetical protein